MAELVEIEQEDARPLLEEMLEDLSSITDKWREVGEVLKVSRATLDELQSHSKGANINDKNSFEVVMKEWIEKNTSAYMWSPLLQILKNNDFPLDYERLTEAHCPLANVDGEHHAKNTDSILWGCGRAKRIPDFSTYCYRSTY